MDNPRSHSKASEPRMLVAWCPDWPVIAAGSESGLTAEKAIAVVEKNRVVACSAMARFSGVRRGMRRREAQSRCPSLVTFAHDITRDARIFERIALAVEELVIGIEIIRPGLIAAPIGGAAKYFGNEESLVEKVIDQIAVSGAECQVGVADGLFPAILAARRSLIIAKNGNREFLSPLGTAELSQVGLIDSEFVDLLRRLGIRTLGGLSALGERDVVSRFGAVGLRAYRLASGSSERPLGRRKPPIELSVEKTFPLALERIDTAAFMAKTLAQDFHDGLVRQGLACVKLGIQADSAEGQHFSRIWTSAEPLTPEAIADRARWQIEGWLKSTSDVRPTAGISRLCLEPVEVIEGQHLQLGLWRSYTSERFQAKGDCGLTEEKASRALVHVQGLLGPESTFTALLDGGRAPKERVHLVRWGDQQALRDSPDAPWADRLPEPAPATVLQQPIPIKVMDNLGKELVVTERKLTSKPSSVLSDSGESPRVVLDWAGPWIAVRFDKSLLRMQLLVEGKGRSTRGLLLVGKGNNPIRWLVEGIYD